MLPPANLWKAMTSPTLDRILRQPVNWSQGIWRSLPQRLNATATLKSMDRTVAIFSRLGSAVPAPWQRWIGQRKLLRSWRRWGADRVWKGSIEKWEIIWWYYNGKDMDMKWFQLCQALEKACNTDLLREQAGASRNHIVVIASQDAYQITTKPHWSRMMYLTIHPCLVTFQQWRPGRFASWWWTCTTCWMLL